MILTGAEVPALLDAHNFLPSLPRPGHDGWLSMEDEDEWQAMLFGRWPVLGDDFVRGPPGSPEAAPREIA